jgi:ketosteroid isomerase-like protein
MSAENVAIVRKAFEAFNREDLDGVVAMCDPAVEWFPPAELPSPTVYHGHQGVRDAIGEMIELFNELQAEPEQLIDVGNQVVVLFVWGGQGKGSGLSLGQFGQQAGVFTMRAGKAIKVEWYLNRVAALQAAGMSETNAHSRPSATPTDG